jgi:hypothetical protein
VGAELIGSIITAGAEKQRRLLSHLSAGELALVAEAMDVLVRVTAEEISGDRSGGFQAEFQAGFQARSRARAAASTSFLIVVGDGAVEIAHSGSFRP